MRVAEARGPILRGRRVASAAGKCGIAVALALPLLSFGATSSTSDYSAEKERVTTDYQSARSKCSQLSGPARTLCFVEAKTVERKAMAGAEARYRGTDSARVEAMVEAAEADFELAKAKCDARAGGDRDVCINAAKAAEARTKAEAIANESIAFRDDEHAAIYEAALAKCDAPESAPNESCTKDAKVNHQK